jgi:hypothetical protein
MPEASTLPSLEDPYLAAGAMLAVTVIVGCLIVLIFKALKK